MDITLKNLVLAGIGGMSNTYEKAQGTIDELVKKGEIAVHEGKELNEELKRKKDEFTPVSAENLKAVLDELDLATKKDLDKLSQRIAKLENK
ncbi:MAG TPA: hypothetical protein DEP42_01420 [Ruminococcaceae bacterium]|nr:hypothetical protein [Oscillospiraceae bacterium]